MTQIDEYERESLELVPLKSLTVLVNGIPTPVTTSVKISVAADGERPTVWQPLDVVGDARGVLIGPGSGFPNLELGMHNVWVKFENVLPEAPVKKLKPQFRTV